MKLIIITLMAILSSVLQAADGGDNGIGIILGEPTGISFKSWLANDEAVDAGIAWSSGRNGRFHLHGDYLWHNSRMFNIRRGKLAVHYGIGGRLRLNDRIQIGFRIPFGLNYLFTNAPFDLFLEIAPTLDLIPGTDFDINGGIGGRFYF